MIEYVFFVEINIYIHLFIFQLLAKTGKFTYIFNDAYQSLSIYLFKQLIYFINKNMTVALEK